MDDFAIRFIISWNINYLWCVNQDLHFMTPLPRLGNHTYCSTDLIFLTSEYTGPLKSADIPSIIPFTGVAYSLSVSDSHCSIIALMSTPNSSIIAFSFSRISASTTPAGLKLNKFFYFTLCFAILSFSQCLLVQRLLLTSNEGSVGWVCTMCRLYTMKVSGKFSQCSP